MQKIMVLLLIIVLSTGFSPASFASDWDVAGKVLTGIEGLRILTRGGVDIIGNITGIKEKRYTTGQGHHKHDYRRHEDCHRVWVPRFVWKKKWIPTHKEYDKRFGEIVVKGHYIKYKVERGGYWDYTCSHDYSRRYSD